MCSAIQQCLDDRKADEFGLALKCLFALLEINDRYIEFRIEKVMDEVLAGVAHNIRYEKESTAILACLREALMRRSTVGNGFPVEALLQKWLLDNLTHHLIDDIFMQKSSKEELRFKQGGRNVNGCNTSVVPLLILLRVR